MPSEVLSREGPPRRAADLDDSGAALQRDDVHRTIQSGGAIWSGGGLDLRVSRLPGGKRRSAAIAISVPDLPASGHRQMDGEITGRRSSAGRIAPRADSRGTLV
jgi:hypothetical protein